MANRKYFDVLVRTPGGLKWKPVQDCLNHAEARAQGESQYAGDILDSRFNGVESDSSSNEREKDTVFDGLFLVAIVIGLILVISMWPIFLIGGIIYGFYKIFKK